MDTKKMDQLEYEQCNPRGCSYCQYAIMEDGRVATCRISEGEKNRAERKIRRMREHPREIDPDF